MKELTPEEIARRRYAQKVAARMNEILATTEGDKMSLNEIKQLAEASMSAPPARIVADMMKG